MTLSERIARGSSVLPAHTHESACCECGDTHCCCACDVFARAPLPAVTRPAVTLSPFTRRALAGELPAKVIR